MSDPTRVTFRCSVCKKVLAAASQHAGKTIECPGCQSRLRVPAPPTARVDAAASQAMPSPHASPNPQPNAGSPATQNRDAQARSKGQQPVARPQVPAAGTPAALPAGTPGTLPGAIPAANQSSSSFGTGFDFPGTENTNRSVVGQQPTAQPAAQPAAQPSPFSVPESHFQQHGAAGGAGSHGSASSASGPRAGTPSMGRNLGGLALACMVSGFAMVVWLLVAAISGHELGVVAWAIGGAVGLVAGLVARNPSPWYCGAAAVIAGMSVVGAKLLMACILMAMSNVSQFLDQLAFYEPEREKYAHALADQMIAENQFQGEQLEAAKFYVSSYFEDGTSYAETPEELEEANEAMQEAVSKRLVSMTDEEKQALVVKARTKYPNWIENHEDFIAACFLLLQDKDQLSDDLAAFARYQIDLENEYDLGEEEFSGNPVELRKQLNQLAAAKLATLSDEQREQAIGDCMKANPHWHPYPDAHVAMMAKLQSEGVFSGPLAEHAQATIDYEMTDDAPDYFDEVDYDEVAKRDLQVGKEINNRLAQLDSQQREQLLRDALAQHPQWEPYNEASALKAKIDLSLNTEPEEEDYELSDGTFSGSLKMVCGWMDLLWLFLGVTTAFGTARKQGTAA